MPMIMSLEGPSLSHIDEVKSQLYAATPKSIWRAQAELSGVLDPIKFHPWAAIGGLILGIWLGGTAGGQAFIAKYAGKKKGK